MTQWTVDLDHARFDFVELAWNEKDHPRNPDGTFKNKGSGGKSSSGSKKKNDSSSKGSGKDEKNGKPSGPARFTDTNGDGKDDRQLTQAELKRALKALSPEMRRALVIYPAVLGAIKAALENGENPKKHLDRLPPNLRDAALKAAKSVAGGSGGSGSAKGQSPKKTAGLSAKEVSDLRKAGWAGNGKSDNDKLYPPNHPDNAESNPSDKKYRKGMSARQISRLPDAERFKIPKGELPKPPKGKKWAEDRSLVDVDFAERAWAVDLDDAVFDFSEAAWKQDEVIELASGKKVRKSALIRKLRNDPKVDDPERLAGWIRHHGSGSGKGSSSGSGSSADKSGGSSGSGSGEPKGNGGNGTAAGPAKIDEKDDPFADPFLDDDDFDEPKSKEELEREKYENKLLRDLEKQEKSKVFEIVREMGGLKTRDDLREEYREIPNTFKRKDGMQGDEMASQMSEFYPEFGIESEDDLIQFLAA